MQHPERLFVIHEVIPSQGRGDLTVPVKFNSLSGLAERQRPLRSRCGLGRRTDDADGHERTRTAPVGARVTQPVSDARYPGATWPRLFLDEEDEAGRDHVVVLSHDLWQRRFDANPLIIGRTVSVDDEPYAVVGVLPATFVFPSLSALYPITITGSGQPQIWKPFAATAADKDPQGGFNFASLAQLGSGVSRAQAVTALNAEQAALRDAGSAAAAPRAALVPLQTQLSERSRTGLTLLSVAVGAVLIIACVNITNLLLARDYGPSSRVRHSGAIGAGRGRVAAQLMVESLFLSTIGGACGVLTAHQAIQLILVNAPADLPLIGSVRIDARPLVHLGHDLLTGLLVGLLPAATCQSRCR